MLRPIALALVLLAFQRAPAAQAVTVADERATGLDPLFDQARRDPDGLVPLILEGSRCIVALDGDQGHALAERLEPYCRRAFFGPERPAGMERLGLFVQRVKKDEFPGTIARRARVSAGLLSRWNEDYDERRLGVGQELKLLDLSDRSLRLVVDCTRHRLAAWRRTPDGAGWLLLAYVPVGLGAPQTPTPAGTTKVVERVLDPPWTDPGTQVTYAPGDPGNLLGGYWVRLDDEGIGKKGIGLHGFTGEDPSVWLGKNASNGCVRLLQDDMDRVFHLALEGTPVQLVP